MIGFPQGLPEYDPVRIIIDGVEDLSTCTVWHSLVKDDLIYISFSMPGIYLTQQQRCCGSATETSIAGVRCVSLCEAAQNERRLYLN